MKKTKYVKKGNGVVNIKDLVSVHSIRLSCELPCSGCVYSDYCKEHNYKREELLNDEDIRNLLY